MVDELGQHQNHHHAWARELLLGELPLAGGRGAGQGGRGGWSALYVRARGTRRATEAALGRGAGCRALGCRASGGSRFS